MLHKQTKTVDGGASNTCRWLIGSNTGSNRKGMGDWSGDRRDADAQKMFTDSDLFL